MSDRTGGTLGSWGYGALVLGVLLLLTLVMQLVGETRPLEGAEPSRVIRVVSPLDSDTMVVALTWTQAEAGTTPVVRYLYELLAGPAAGELVQVVRDSVEVTQPRFVSWTGARPPAGTCSYIQARVVARDQTGLLSRDGWGNTEVMELCSPHAGPTTPVPSLDTASVAIPGPDSIQTYPAHLDLALGEVAPMCAYQWDGEERRPLPQARWAVTDRTIGLVGPPPAADSTHCMRLEAIGVPTWDPEDDEAAVFIATWRYWQRQGRGSWPAFVSAYEAGELREPGVAIVTAAPQEQDAQQLNPPLLFRIRMGQQLRSGPQ